MQKLSIIQRLLADVDPYVKKVQIIAVTLLMGFIIAATTFPSLLTNKYALMALGGLVLVIVITAFTARIEQKLEANEPITLQLFQDVAGQLISDVAAVKEMIANPPKSITDAVDTVNKLAPEVQIGKADTPAAPVAQSTSPLSIV